MERYYGKYRGVVTSNTDPLMSGRIRATVPDVLGDTESGWALPCFPVGGNGEGFYGVPSNGAGVWIEFEQGDPDYPIWSGCWAGSMADVPSEVLTALGKAIVLKTAGGNKIVLDDTPGIGGIVLETSTGQKIKLGVTAIEIDNGMGATIKLGMGPQVSINNGALEVLF